MHAACIADVHGSTSHASTINIKTELAQLPHLPLAHWDAGAVPKALVRLCLFVIVVPAWAQRRAQLILVLRKAL